MDEELACMALRISQCKHGVMRYLGNDAVIGRSLELYGEFSDREVGLLEQLLEPGAVLFEVGANIGAITVPLAKRVGPEGRVYALEPQALLHALLEENVRANGLANVVALHCAAGAVNGTVRLPAVDYADPAGNFGGVSLAEGGADGELVALRALDDWERLERVDLVKIDVEGLEAGVIRGAQRLIAKHRPLLYVENDREARSADLIALIQELGYRLFWHTPPLYDEGNYRACRRNVWPGMVSVNMLCIPRERALGEIRLREITSPQARWKDATRPYERVRRARGGGQKSAAVLRPGAYGDALMASSVIAGLHAEGYHVTVYTEGPGEEILRHDPHVDRLLWLPLEEVTIADIVGYFLGEAEQYDRAVNLVETVEKNLLAIPRDLRFYWPQAARELVFAGNYLETMHRVAGLPHVPAQRFHETPEECARARRFAERRGPFALVAVSGSTAPKFWPYVPELAAGLEVLGYDVVIAGELRGLAELALPDSARVHAIGTRWPMREVLALAKQADVVIGQETGILNAVALEPMRKVLLLSHSTRENLARDWVNTVALAGHVECYPCHRVHLAEVGMRYCTSDAKTGAAACQAAISVERVLAAVPRLDLVAARLMKGAA